MRHLVVAAAALVALGAPSTAPASARDDGTYRGGCALVATADRFQLYGPDAYHAVISAAVAAFAPNLGHNPVEADVACVVEVNGRDVLRVAAGPDAPGLTVLDPVGVVFVQPAGSVLVLCTEVRLRDPAGSKLDRACAEADDVALPPGEVRDLAGPGCAALDPAVCGLADEARTTVVVAAAGRLQASQ